MASGLLSAGRGTVDLDEPDLQLLIHHEVEAKELEAVVWEVPCADGRLHACEAAPVAEGTPVRGRAVGTGYHVCHPPALT